VAPRLLDGLPAAADSASGIAKSQHTTVIEVVHSSIDALERREFLRGLNDDYRRLREDPELWRTYVAEHEEWDALA
jgi:hypothetical protein